MPVSNFHADVPDLHQTTKANNCTFVRNVLKNQRKLKILQLHVCLILQQTRKSRFNSLRIRANATELFALCMYLTFQQTRKPRSNSQQSPIAPLQTFLRIGGKLPRIISYHIKYSIPANCCTVPFMHLVRHMQQKPGSNKLQVATDHIQVKSIAPYVKRAIELKKTHTTAFPLQIL